jgi:hypothetical protein
MNSVRLSALNTGCLHPVEDTLVFISIRGRVDPSAVQYVPETNHVFKVHCVAAMLQLRFVVHVMLFPVFSVYFLVLH